MESKPKFKPNPKLKLMAQVTEVLRYHHYAYRTEQAYCQWIRQFIRFYESKRHPSEMGVTEVEAFLSHLTSERKVATATQKQALNALVFLYREVLDLPLEGKMTPVRSTRSVRLPTVLTSGEVESVFKQMEGTHALMAMLLYGAGLRLMECVRLRIKDVDLGQRMIVVRGGKGDKDRSTVLPELAQVLLEAHVKRVIALHQQDLSEGFGEVYLPGALAAKYPNAGRETGWQYVFPGRKRSVDPRSGRERRHHVLESGLQKAMKAAVLRAGIHKRATCHTLRHSFATHLLENGTNIRIVQELMGHKSVKTTEIYTHVMQRDLRQLKSPLDRLAEAGKV